MKAVHTTRRYRHPNQQCDCPGPTTVSSRRTSRDVLQLKRTHVVGHHSPRSRPSSPAMSCHPLADRVSRLAINLVPTCQSGHATTPPKRITTMQTDTWIDHWRDRRDQHNAALSQERMTSQRHQVRECSKLLAVLGYGQQALTEWAPRLMTNPADLPFTTPLWGYRPTASLRRYLDHHLSEPSL